ncbi:hypothetical protein L873DRAFT_1841918 [Choiromyces venosus 120613-1]|uniref:BTB domain-containing protein n=1 Tax=Choiromyces venosus 120613-1 TaxID=1336337 RepID=A0A3N4K902_9PEZI|nr:hypothetical protein L873DRAFT_1841918 [Choiromyces venosus 120613-1]
MWSTGCTGTADYENDKVMTDTSSSLSSAPTISTGSAFPTPSISDGSSSYMSCSEGTGSEHIYPQSGNLDDEDEEFHAPFPINPPSRRRKIALRYRREFRIRDIHWSDYEDNAPKKPPPVSPIFTKGKIADPLTPCDNPGDEYDIEVTAETSLDSNNQFPPSLNDLERCIMILSTHSPTPVSFRPEYLLSQSVWFANAWNSYGQRMLRVSNITRENLVLFREFLMTGRYTLPWKDSKIAGTREEIELLLSFPQHQPAILERHIDLYLIGHKYKVAELLSYSFTEIYKIIAKEDLESLGAHLRFKHGSMFMINTFVKSRFELISKVYQWIQGTNELKYLLAKSMAEDWTIYSDALEWYSTPIGFTMADIHNVLSEFMKDVMDQADFRGPEQVSGMSETAFQKEYVEWFDQGGEDVISCDAEESLDLEWESDEEISEQLLQPVDSTYQQLGIGQVPLATNHDNFEQTIDPRFLRNGDPQDMEIDEFDASVLNAHWLYGV